MLKFEHLSIYCQNNHQFSPFCLFFFVLEKPILFRPQKVRWIVFLHFIIQDFFHWILSCRLLLKIWNRKSVWSTPLLVSSCFPIKKQLWYLPRPSAGMNGLDLPLDRCHGHLDPASALINDRVMQEPDSACWIFTFVSLLQDSLPKWVYFRALHSAHVVPDRLLAVVDASRARIWWCKKIVNP